VKKDDIVLVVASGVGLPASSSALAACFALAWERGFKISERVQEKKLACIGGATPDTDAVAATLSGFSPTTS
jgi:hypothetical protein